MTVNQIMRSYVKDLDNGKRSYNRNAIHGELFLDTAKQVFAATKESKHQQDIEKIFGNAVDNVHMKFMNIYAGKENVDKEWKIFYATFIVPLKVFFGVIQVKITDSLNVSRYMDTKLSEEQKIALVATGLNKPMLNESNVNYQLDTITRVIGDCIHHYGLNDNISLANYNSKINIARDIFISTGLEELKIKGFIEKPKQHFKRPNLKNKGDKKCNNKKDTALDVVEK